MDRILTYTIKPEQEGMQLLDFLRSKGFSRGILSSMKADKSAIQLNGERGFGKSVLQAGDSLLIHWRMELPGISKKKDSISSTAASTVWTETPQEP